MKSSAIFKACRAGNAGKVRELLSSQAHILRMHSHEGYSLLHYAIKDDYLDVLTVLLGASSQIIMDSDQTPIINSRTNNTHHTTTFHGKSPLAMAIHFDRREFIKLLIEHGANVSAASMYSLLELAIKYEQEDESFAKIILQVIAPNGQILTDLYSGLVQAVYSQNKAPVQFLLEHGIDPNSMISGGVSILYEATTIDNLELVQLLVKYKADINHRVPDEIFPTALNVAVVSGYDSITRYLLSQGANANIENSSGSLPYQCGCFAVFLEYGYPAEPKNVNTLQELEFYIDHDLNPQHMREVIIRFSKALRHSHHQHDLDKKIKLARSDHLLRENYGARNSK